VKAFRTGKALQLPGVIGVAGEDEDLVVCGEGSEGLDGGGEEERFVGAFVRRTFLDRGGARVEVVKPFDGRVQGHGGSLSGLEAGGKQKRTENQMGEGEKEEGETEDRRQKTEDRRAWRGLRAGASAGFRW
jgi:hypothetical protein